jgi:hypothetical protein
VLTLNNPDSRAQPVTTLGLKSGSDNFLTTTTCGSTLAARTSCDISVLMRPSQAGALAGEIEAKLGSGIVNATLSGTGVAPAPVFSYNPNTTLPFSAKVGGYAVQTVTLTNTGTGAGTLPANSASFSGAQANQYNVQSDTCSGATLQPTTGSCSYIVRYTPTAAGSANANLNLQNPQGTVSIGLTGSATAPQYATLDPASAIGAGAPGSVSGGLDFTAGGNGAYIRTTFAGSGNFYFEVTNIGSSYIGVGLTTGAANSPLYNLDVRGDWYYYNPVVKAGSYGAWPTYVGIAWNADTKTAHLYYDGVYKASHTFNSVTGPVYPMLYSSGGSIRANFGQSSFGSRVPAGYTPGISK